jgi:hypothetical protein
LHSVVAKEFSWFLESVHTCFFLVLKPAIACTASSGRSLVDTRAVRASKRPDYCHKARPEKTA